MLRVTDCSQAQNRLYSAFPKQEDNKDSIGKGEKGIREPKNQTVNGNTSCVECSRHRTDVINKQAEEEDWWNSWERQQATPLQYSTPISFKP